MADVVFRNVTKRYKQTVAVDNASFAINDNEFFCFFGPPLSGKSTILRLILGLEAPDSGEILIGGREVNKVTPAERNVAMVFQNLVLFPHMTARQNVRFPLVERKVSEAAIEKRVAEVSAKLHIAHILHKPPAQLSGGERQRVAIARALVRDPSAYLTDDPISALDARLREETRVELKRIQRELDKTLVYVTHDQEEAMSVADRMAILDRGRISQIGAPSAIYDRPTSIYVARQLGAPVMNILKSAQGPAGIEAADGAIRITDTLAPAQTAEIGVRPEDVKIAPWSDGAGRPAQVYEVEPLGDYTVVTLDAGKTRFRALLRGQPPIRPEALVAISCDPSRVHYFEAAGDAIVR